MAVRILPAGLLVTALALSAAAAWVTVVPQPARAITDCQTASDGLDSQELEMLALVNAARAQAGAGPLAVSPNLNRAAAWKSEDSSASGPGFSHTDSLGRAPFERAVDCGYPTGAAENIAYGYPSAQATLTAWMGSPGHRANILNASYVAIGIGRSGSAWTLNFGFVDDSGSPPPQPAATNTPTATSVPPTDTPAPTSTPIPANTIAAQPTATPTQVVVQQPAAPAQPTLAPLPTATRPAPPPPAGVPESRNLGTGINMVTYTGETQPVAPALASIAGDVEWVYTWNGVRWLRYVPGMPPYINTLTVLQNGTTYIIAMERAGTWSY
jgi:uncharacterized protein YkwD